MFKGIGHVSYWQVSNGADLSSNICFILMEVRLHQPVSAPLLLIMFEIISLRAWNSGYYRATCSISIYYVL